MPNVEFCFLVDLLIWGDTNSTKKVPDSIFNENIESCGSIRLLFMYTKRRAFDWKKLSRGGELLHFCIEYMLPTLVLWLRHRNCLLPGERAIFTSIQCVARPKTKSWHGRLQPTVDTPLLIWTCKVACEAPRPLMCGKRNLQQLYFQLCLTKLIKI